MEEMKMSTREDSLESNGFRMVANKTIAKGSSSWVDTQGRLHFREVVPTGTPEKVKQVLSASKQGEKTELEFAHNTKVYEREIEEPNTNGVIKEREIVVVQEDSVGDGGQSPTPSEPTTHVTNYDVAPTIPEPRPQPEKPTVSTYQPSMPSNELTPLQVLKNFVDKQADYLKWTMIGTGVGFTVLALALGVTIGKAFF